MVILRVSEGERPHKFMTMVPGRSKPLHNFSMPCLKWGNQKLLRCMKVNSNGETGLIDRRSFGSEAESESLVVRKKESESESESDRSPSPNHFDSLKKSTSPPIEVSGEKSKIDTDGDDTIESLRKKLVFHLRNAADKMTVTIPEEKEKEESVMTRLRNLSTRGAACKSPDEAGEARGGGGEGSKGVEKKQNSSPLRNENLTTKSLRLRGLATAQHVQKKERAKFSISLSRDEIEKDFLGMTGARPPRRPKKRAKIIQKQLDANFPGLWLSEINPNSYKVPHPKTA